jgi:hypothetical protein
MKRFMVIGLVVAGCLFSCSGCSSLGPTPDKRAVVESHPETKTDPATPVLTNGNSSRTIQGMVDLFAALLVGPKTPDPSQSVAP